MTSGIIKFVNYKASHQELWDSFVTTAKNSYFFFKRGFMEYHSDRFKDYSLLVYYDDRLVALLPAHLDGEVLSSHKGLTFGGFLLSEEIKLMKMIEIVNELKVFLAKQGIKELIYKAIPYVYHSKPCDEDLFALYKAGAKHICREITSVIKLSKPIGFSKGKKGSIKKAKKEGVSVKESSDLKEYFSMMERLLREKYQTKPVHSYDEMKLLIERFPSNIKLYAAYQADSMLAGVLLFIDENIIKTQYISSTEEGRYLGAVDLIIETLISETYPSKEYFDFGTSVENSELSFNESLIAQKELFGARAIVKDVYQLSTGALV